MITDEIKINKNTIKISDAKRGKYSLCSNLLPKLKKAIHEPVIIRKTDCDFRFRERLTMQPSIPIKNRPKDPNIYRKKLLIGFKDSF